MKNLFLFFLVLFMTNCTKDNTIYKKTTRKWDKISGRLNTILIIGSDSTTFFSDPEFIITDSTHKIIIADQGRNKLLVFNLKGKLLYTIGKRGPGPGEFRSIIGIGKSGFNKILVFDRISQSVEEYKTSGKYIRTYVPNKILTATVSYAKWKNYNFLFYGNFRRGQEKNKVLHVFTKKYKLKNNFINVLSMKDIKSYVSYLLVRRSGSFLLENDILYFTPSIYNGLIYKYAVSGKEEDEISLRLIDTISGLVYKKPSERHEGENLAYADATTTLRGGKTFQVLIHNQSKGLFQLSNDKIVHFTYIENKEATERIFGVEVYDENMNPIGYVTLKTVEFNPKNSFLLQWKVAWKDNQDRFYIIDESGIPTIRVVKLEIGGDI